jgi:hypothetical protein
MQWKRPVPVKKENITVGDTYYSCSYTGTIKVRVIKIFADTDCVLAEIATTKRNKRKNKPFVRSMDYLFDDPEMAKSAGRDWEHDERKRKREKREKKKNLSVN